MKPEYLQLAAEIERLIGEAGVKMTTKKAASMEACIVTGYILGLRDCRAEDPTFLHLMLCTGRRLTDEARRVKGAAA
jgi:hypothetical protein